METGTQTLPCCFKDLETFPESLVFYGELKDVSIDATEEEILDARSEEIAFKKELESLKNILKEKDHTIKKLRKDKK